MVDLEALFPGLHGASFQVTSPATEIYNCIAWAAGDVGRWWWHDVLGQRYWPPGVVRAETLAAFQDAFASLGFVLCQTSDVDPGFEKIALYAVDQDPQHAARQLANGRWTSKLGELEDIEHSLADLEGVEYGKVVVLMKRPISAP
jgi:hypothetical protein